jgi:hypothetical protein
MQKIILSAGTSSEAGLRAELRVSGAERLISRIYESL